MDSFRTTHVSSTTRTIIGRRLQLGFTLVELLVVITIIGMLMALLMPAVSAAREAARRLTCQNNVKQLIIACKSFQAARGNYPGWTNSMPSSTAGKAFTGTWIAEIMPNLDRNDIANSMKNNASMPLSTVSTSTSASLVKVLVCPSDPPDTLTNAGPCAYICNGLVFRISTTSSTTPPLNDDYLTQNDGQANTLMISENLAHDPSNTAAPTAKFHNWYDLNQATQTFGFPLPNPPYTAAVQSYANFYAGQNTMALNIKSAHSGGAIGGFFDSHVTFISDALGTLTATGGSGYVYQSIVTPDGTTISTTGSPWEPAFDESQL